MIEQRLGESDAEYEARKRRVRLQRNVSSDMFAHAGGGGGGLGFTPNMCITQGNDGIVEWYGATLADPAFGTIDPNETALGQKVYALKWRADGIFRMRFGVLGNEIVPDTNIILVTTRVTPVILVWDAVNLYYRGINLSIATELINEYVEGEDRCALVKPIPNLFISYNMNIEDIEGTDTLINQIALVAPEYNATVTNATQNGPGSILVDATTSIPTGFKPSIARYSIEESVSGELQDFGSEKFTGVYTSGGALTTVGDNTSGSISTDPTQNWLGFSLDSIAVEEWKVEINVTMNIGEYTVSKYFDGVGYSDLDTPVTLVTGDNTIIAPGRASGAGNTCYVSGIASPQEAIDITFNSTSITPLTTKTQRTEQRLLTHGPVDGDKYYIDGIEQAVTPALPDPAVTINLGNTAVIGYPDTITQRNADFNVHTEILTPTLEPVGQNLYPNFNMQNGSDIVQDVPTGTLPDNHVLAFNTANPCDAFYTTPDNMEYWYLFNTTQDTVRLVLQQTIGYGIFEVGKAYRYQARVRTLTDTPIGAELRAIHIAAAVELVLIDNDNAMIGENEDYTLRWIDFEVTDTAVGRANFRHGVGVWDVLPTAQDTRDIAIYELGLSNDEIQITHNGEDVVHEREPVIK